MSNKYLIPLIVAILISTIVAVSVNQFDKFSNSKVAIVSSSSFVMAQSSVVSISSQAVSSSSNSNLESSPGKVQEPLQSQTSATQSYIPDPMRQLQVEVLDSNNPPKYIIDYLACQKTSSTKEYGLLVEEEDGKLDYKCPKSLEYYGCKDLGENPTLPRNKLLWLGESYTENKLKEEFRAWSSKRQLASETITDVLNTMHFKDGWACNTLFIGGRESFGCSANYGSPIDDLKLNYITNNQVATLSSSFSNCIVIINKDIPIKDIQLLKNYKSVRAGNLKFVTIKN
jgi:hypothetical protein